MARPFTVIGFTMFFTLALVFELGQKAAVVILVYNGGRCSAFVFCRRTCSERSIGEFQRQRAYRESERCLARGAERRKILYRA